MTVMPYLKQVGKYILWGIIGILAAIVLVFIIIGWWEEIGAIVEDFRTILSAI